MSLKKRMNKSLALGLIIGSVCMSANNVHAVEKIELNKEEIAVQKREIVTTSVLNVREGASEEDEKIGALLQGSVVEVLETKDGWDKIQFSEDEEGWVSSEFTVNEKAKVKVAELNLRKGPSVEEDKLELLDHNTNLEVLSTVEVENKDEVKEMWYEVKVLEDESKEESNKSDKKEDKKEDKKGWVFAQLVLTESEEAKLKEEEAKRKLEAEIKAQTESKTTVSNTTSLNTTSSNTTSLNTTSSNTTSNNSSSSDKKEPVQDNNQSSNVSGRTLTVNASAYSGHTITATGTVPKWGTIAVDPSVIPYGTKVYIPMFDKVFIAEDCGGAIKGNKIDIFMNSSEECYNFGRRNIEIKILG